MWREGLMVGVADSICTFFFFFVMQTFTIIVAMYVCCD